VSCRAKFSRIPAWALGADLTETDWRVLCAICLHADKEGRAYPSLARIAEIARIHRNHVSRSTRRLQQFGLIRTSRLRRGEGWANTHYEVVYDPPASVAPNMVAPDGGPVLADEVALKKDLLAPDRVAPPPEKQVAPGVVAYGTCNGSTDGTWDGALTYQLRDQETDHPYQERVSKVEIEDGHGVAAAEAALAAECVRCVAGGHVCRDCPYLPGPDICADRELNDLPEPVDDVQQEGAL